MVEPTPDQIDNGFPPLPEIDVDIELQPVPEPSTMIGLLAVGGLGIASKLKKKSQ